MMQRKFSQTIALVVGISILLFHIPLLAQEDYPNKPIGIVNPGGPGGPLPLGLRFFADKWAEFLGQPVIITDKVGVGGIAGTRFVLQSKPDGYTLLGTTHTCLITSPLDHKDVGYNIDSFRILFNHSKIVVFFSVKPDARWKSLNDFVKEARDNPGKLKYACLGKNTSTDMATEMLSAAARIKLTLVPFNTSPESLTALMGGNVDMAVTWGLSGGLGKSGMVRPLAVSDVERLPDYPDVPTLKELGFPIAYNGQELGLAAPAKTPEMVLSRFIEAHRKVLAKYSKEIRERLPQIDQYPFNLEEKGATELLKEREKMFKEFYVKMGVVKQ